MNKQPDQPLHVRTMEQLRFAPSMPFENPRRFNMSQNGRHFIVYDKERICMLDAGATTPAWREHRWNEQIDAGIHVIPASQGGFWLITRRQATFVAPDGVNQCFLAIDGAPDLCWGDDDWLLLQSQRELTFLDIATNRRLRLNTPDLVIHAWRQGAALRWFAVTPGQRKLRLREWAPPAPPRVLDEREMEHAPFDHERDGFSVAHPLIVGRETRVLPGGGHRVSLPAMTIHAGRNDDIVIEARPDGLSAVRPANSRLSVAQLAIASARCIDMDKSFDHLDRHLLTIERDDGVHVITTRGRFLLDKREVAALSPSRSSITPQKPESFRLIATEAPEAMASNNSNIGMFREWRNSGRREAELLRGNPPWLTSLMRDNMIDNLQRLQGAADHELPERLLGDLEAWRAVTGDFNTLAPALDAIDRRLADRLEQCIRAISVCLLPATRRALPARLRGGGAEFARMIERHPGLIDWAIRRAPGSFFSRKRLPGLIRHAAEQESLALLVDKLRPAQQRNAGQWPEWTVRAFAAALAGERVPENRALLLCHMLMEGMPIPPDQNDTLARLARILPEARDRADEAVGLLVRLADERIPMSCAEPLLLGAANRAPVPQFLGNLIVMHRVGDLDDLVESTDTNMFGDTAPEDVVHAIWTQSESLSPNARKDLARMLLRLLKRLAAPGGRSGAPALTTEAALLMEAGKSMEERRREIETWMESHEA